MQLLIKPYCVDHRRGMAPRHCGIKQYSPSGKLFRCYKVRKVGSSNPLQFDQPSEIFHHSSWGKCILWMVTGTNNRLIKLLSPPKSRRCCGCMARKDTRPGSVFTSPQRDCGHRPEGVWAVADRAQENPGFFNLSLGTGWDIAV
ncbi:NHL repeat-containing protein 3 [Lates japonicus]|uniref:NHL repeat-containing protein 3 n=1 Tax=Lates japonicus TaxID=270547 RepID=A0AAD3NE04_LATJO|nr:NHL repeat-containing protein 3 [Lates japonicus]